MNKELIVLLHHTILVLQEQICRKEPFVMSWIYVMRFERVGVVIYGSKIRALVQTCLKHNTSPLQYIY